jgi:hypothetical protein
MSGSDLVWMCRAGDGMFLDDRRCFPGRKRAHGYSIRRKRRRTWKSFPEPALWHRRIFGITRIRSLAADGPCSQKICLVLTQASGLRVLYAVQPAACRRSVPLCTGSQEAKRDASPTTRPWRRCKRRPHGRYRPFWLLLRRTGTTRLRPSLYAGRVHASVQRSQPNERRELKPGSPKCSTAARYVFRAAGIGQA